MKVDIEDGRLIVTPITEEDAENGRRVDPSRHAPFPVLSLLSEALSTRTGRPIKALSPESSLTDLTPQSIQEDSS